MKKNIQEIVASKIPAFYGRDAKTNLTVLEKLVVKGPQTVWNVNKLLGRSQKEYPTIFRAISRLCQRGYLEKTGTVKMQKKKGRTPVYGVTWRGLFASLSSEKVCANIRDVIDKNEHMKPPFPKEAILPIIKELFGDRAGRVLKSLFEGFILVMPQDIESIKYFTFASCYFPAVNYSLNIIGKEIKEENIPVLRIYPEVINWFEKILDDNVKRLEQQLKAVRELQERLSKIRMESVR